MFSRRTRSYCFYFTLFFSLYTRIGLGQTAEIRKLQRQLPLTRDSLQYVDGLNRIGILIHLKSADSCLFYGIQAKAIADRHHYVKGQATALGNIAAALFLKGLYNQALQLFAGALTEYESIGDSTGVAQMMMNSAVVYEVLGDTTNTRKFATTALHQTVRLSADSVKSILYLNYCYLLPNANPDTSAYYLNEAKRIAGLFKDDRAWLVINQLQSDQLVAAGQTHRALPFIQEALRIARRNQWEYHEINGLDYYANYFIKRNQLDSAITCYQRSLDLASANGFITFKIEILKSLQKCYQLQRNSREIAAINQLLVDALEEERENSKHFIGDYITYYITQQQLSQLETQARHDQKMIGILVGFLVLSLAVIGVVVGLYRKLRASARIQLALNDTISEQNKLLLESDEFRAKLISILAHDFRSPLSSTLSLVGFIKENYDLDASELELYYESLQNKINNLLRVFDSILQWVKKQYSGYTATPETVPLRNLVEEAAALYQNQMDEKKLTLANQVDEPFSLRTDREIIQFINRNLIHNAIKFSPVGGTITIWAETNQTETIISVKDEGRGMNPEQLASLFSFDSSTRRPLDQSAGVALTICKDFIAKLNGRIWAESQPGNGTTFYYAIPIDARDDETASTDQ